MTIAVKLEKRIAEQIVQRTMQIIDLNINVMDEHGCIIASGDSERIGRKHDGALLAIAKGDTVSIDEGAANHLSGVKPGVNLLLQFNHQVLGVIGITGNPIQVVQYGRLVKMAAELIIEQSHSIQQHQWGNRQKEELITQWVKGSTEWSSLKKWAQRLQIDLEAPRVACVIEVQSSQEPLKKQAMRDVLDLLENPQRNNLVAMISLNEIVVLKPYQPDHALETQRVTSLLERANKVKGIKLSIAVGPYFNEPKRITDSYQCAKITLTIGKQNSAKSQSYFYDDYKLPVLLSQLNDDWRYDALQAPIKRLLDKDTNGQLIKTLHQYFIDYPDLKACSENLHIHRNSLRYRLNKIEKITLCRLDKLDTLTQLYVASTLQKQ